MTSPHDPKVPDREIAKALVATKGNISAAARVLTQSLSPPVVTERRRVSAPTPERTSSAPIITRAYVKRRIDSSPALQALLEDIRESILDDAESNVFKQVKAGNTEESKFVLTTLGRSRGYVKTTVVEDTDAALLAKRIQDARRANQAEPTGAENTGSPSRNVESEQPDSVRLH